ncbi:sucrase ferredoxin [Nocardioides silvaticus]|uniref:sucrase ferredoxin n=1 Tax=Nocardioides silvaticus TaxID=2201891 RepID=UPI001304B9F4|nr:sucrase ferredoxin [Nocardioides silvaticus]
METSTTRFSCAAASALRDEPLAGTATHVRTWLLLEHSGPWGADALLDARLPEGLGAALKQQAKAYRAKILLVRRARAKRDPERLNVFAAFADHRRPRLEHGTVADLREVLDLDLTAFREGGSTGLSTYDGPLFCVCTNGRHDACCAEFGRPVAMALDDAYPEYAWEVSHIGGDRFAGNLVVLPEGLYYGRLDPQQGVALAGAHLAGDLDLDHLRGRSAYPMAVQAAEHHLRRQLGESRITAVVLQRRTVEDDVTTATFTAAGATYDVRVRTTRDPATATRLTCKAHRDNPVPRHELLGIDPA